jgi:hypothetical protein
MANNKGTFPYLTQIKDVAIRESIRLLWEAIQTQAGRGGQTARLEGPLDAGGFKLTNVGEPSSAADVVTKEYGDANYGPSAVRLALQAGGTSPIINTTSSGGTESFHDTHANRITLGQYAAGTLDEGTFFFETDRLALYQIQSVAGVLSWVYIGGRPMPVTLSPNTKPADLATPDAGFEIYSTDFDRLYTWDGTAWVDGMGQERRFQIAFFTDALVTTGWALCDGVATTRSAADGTTAAFTPPDLVTANRFLRSVSGATGGTGGAAQANPPSTTSTGPNNTTEVQSGVGTDVASDDHTHDVDLAAFDILPPYMNMRPYIRL